MLAEAGAKKRAGTEAAKEHSRVESQPDETLPPKKPPGVRTVATEVRKRMLEASDQGDRGIDADNVDDYEMHLVKKLRVSPAGGDDIIQQPASLR